MSENTTFAGFGSPNYTQVPDELFDQLMPDLSGAELKVLLYIIRRTFGFKKNSDPISFNQFLDGIKGKDGKILDRGCGIKSRDKLNNALKSLLSKGIITAEKRADIKGGKQTTVYSLRFRTEVSSQEASTETVLGGSPQKGLGVVPKRDLQETVKQETENLSNIRKESSQENDKTDEPEQGRPELLAAQPTMSLEASTRLQEAPSPHESRRAGKKHLPNLDLHLSNLLVASQPLVCTRTALVVNCRNSPLTPFRQLTLSASGVVVVTCWLREAL
jgi:hypothetical protein